MLEIGQSSRALEEEEFRDIPVDTEQLIGYAPMAPVQPDDVGDEAEANEAEEAEAEGSEEASEADPEEAATEPAGYHDDMGTTADDIIEELTNRNVQLEERVALLEGQNAVHQETEDRYRSETYQLQFEVIELRARIQQMVSTTPLLGPTVQQLMLQNSQLKQALERSQIQRVELRVALQTVEAERDRERAERDRVQELWVRAASEVDLLEREARGRYPQDEGSSRRVIRRQRVDRRARPTYHRDDRHSRR